MAETQTRDSTALTSRERVVEVDLQGYLFALNELTRRYRIGIANEPTLFVMETDDNLFSYVTDADGRLVRH